MRGFGRTNLRDDKQPITLIALGLQRFRDSASKVIETASPWHWLDDGGR